MRALRNGVVAALAVTAVLAAGQPARAAGPPPIQWIGGGQVGVLATAVSPDQQTIAVAGGDDTAKLWSATDHKLLHTLAGHEAGVRSVAFTPDNKSLVSGGEVSFGSSSSPLKLWRVADGSFVRDFQVPPTSAHVNGVAVSPDGTLVAAAQSSGEVNLFRTSDGTLVRTLTGHTDQAFSVAFSPDGTTLASGSGDNTVRIWRVADGRVLKVLKGHTFLVVSVAFSPDGQTLASGSFDGTVRLWRTGNFKLAQVLQHPDAVNAVAFSADSQTLASVGSFFDARLWQVSTGTLVRTLSGSATDSPSSVAFLGSAAGTTPQTVAVGGFGGHVGFWKSSDGTFLGSMGGHTASVRSVAFDPTGKLLASSSEDFTAKLWNTADGTVVRTLAGHTDVINAVAFSPDSSLIATAAGGPPPDTTESTIRIWRTGTGELLQTLPGHVSGSTGVAFSADGQTLISSGRDNTLRFWRVADGTLIRAVTTGNSSEALAMSPDRSTVAVQGAVGIQFYSAADGTLVGSTSDAGNVTSLSFSGDGTLLAAGAEDAAVRIFDVATGTLLRTLTDPQTGPVQGVAFAPTGTTLASGSGFSFTIQLWDAATGTLRTTYDQETGWGPFAHLPVAFSPDGAFLGYGRGDATVVLARA
jgi:WD40 repeat protein